MGTFHIIAMIVLSLYAVGVMHLIFAVLRSSGSIRTIPGILPAVSVIIPMRNEAHNLPSLLASLLKQDYPAAYEILLVDDGSTDNYATAVAKAGAPDVIRIVNHVFDPSLKCNGRKQAVSAGCRQAKYPTGAIASADMIMHETWLASLALCAKGGSTIILGHTALIGKKKTPFIRLQAFQDELFTALKFAWTNAGFPLRTDDGVMIGDVSTIANHMSGNRRGIRMMCAQPFSISAITFPIHGFFPFLNHILRTIRSLFSPRTGMFPVAAMMCLQNTLLVAAIAGALPRRLALISFVNFALAYVFCAVAFRKMRSVEDPAGFFLYFPMLLLETIGVLLAFVIQPRTFWKGRHL